MTSRRTDRYARRGGPVPTIYPGTLAGLTQALKDAQSASRFLPGVTHSVWAVRGRERECVRAFQAGREHISPEAGYTTS